MDLHVFGILCIVLVLTSVTCLDDDPEDLFCLGPCSPFCNHDCIVRGYKYGGACFAYIMCCCKKN
ncbi:hypothetical protein AAZX31_18G160800 [Glycine max]